MSNYQAWNHDFSDSGLCTKCGEDFLDVEAIDCQEQKS
jgi:hypothetical protein